MGHFVIGLSKISSFFSHTNKKKYDILLRLCKFRCIGINLILIKNTSEDESQVKDF